MVSPTYATNHTTLTTFNLTGSAISGSVPGTATAATLTTQSSIGRVEHNGSLAKPGGRWSLGGTIVFADGDYFSFQFKERTFITAMSRITFALFDSLGNWAEFEAVQGLNLLLPRVANISAANTARDWAQCSVAKGATPSAGSATDLDWSGVTHVEIFIPSGSSASRGIWIKNARRLKPPLVTNGEIANPAGIGGLTSAYFTLPDFGWFDASTWDKRLPTSNYIFSTGLLLGNGSTLTYFDSQGDSLSVQRTYGETSKLYNQNSSFLPELLINMSASDTIIFNRLSITSGGNSYDITTQGTGSLTVTESTIQNAAVLDLRSGSFSSVFFNNITSIIFAANTAATLSNCNVVDCGFEINISGTTPVDLSAFTATIKDGKTYDIRISNSSPGTGQTYNLNISGITQGTDNATAAANRIRVLDSTASNTYNITTSSSYTSGDVSSAGAVVNIIAPQPTLTLTNLVAGSRVYVQNTTDDVELFNEIEATTTWSETVPSGKALLIRVRNSSGTPNYKTFQTTTGALTSDTSITINQELDE